MSTFSSNSSLNEYVQESTLMYNVALVGHVSNGKTTLVQALTGVDTKRSSKERELGRTIKLGYATCQLWKCPCCMYVRSLGYQAHAKSPPCPQCHETLVAKQLISFVDAPGHHSYVHTMVKGSATVDYAIVVTDARKDSLQVQTLEHLAILSLLEVRQVIIVQNKVDLADEEQCKRHYHMLQRELRGTCGEGAPILPLSSSTGHNIPQLAALLQRMLDRRIAPRFEMRANLFTIIRSFDINSPQRDARQLLGGVIGGTFFGTRQIHVDTEMVILPGLVGKGKTHTPLTTTITSILCESTPFSTIGAGGLFGVGTTLDPCCTAKDRLVGSVLAFPDQLPPVVTALEVSLRPICLQEGKRAHRMIQGMEYIIILGNAVIRATFQGYAPLTKRGVFDLHTPVVVYTNRCLVYHAETSEKHMGASELVALGIVDEFRVPIEPVLEPLVFTHYIALLPSHYIERQVHKIPVPRLVRENKNRIWENIGAYEQVLGRPAAEIVTFMKEETKVEMSICARGVRMTKCTLDERKCSILLRKYIRQHVVCPQCGGFQTTDSACLTCGATMRRDLQNA